jgi:aminoglycoside phosphotransferase (APT) family kinase protein
VIGRAVPPNPRHNWLAAVIPSDARRFRVDDPRLAATLVDAGAEIVESQPDVEIGPIEVLSGEAPFAVTSIERLVPEGGSRIERAARRWAGSLRVRVQAARRQRAIESLGYPKTAVVLWEWEQVLRLPGVAGGPNRISLVERLPLAALALGYRRTAPTALQASLVTAQREAGMDLQPRWPLVRQGGVVTVTRGGVLRVAIGPARRELHRMRAALDELSSAAPTTVASRVPWVIAAGREGLADWLLERTLAGTPARPRLSERLMSDCLEFLAALHLAGRDPRPTGALVEDAAILVERSAPAYGPMLAELGERLESELADLPRGFGHGDFWTGNLLVQSGRLVGVVDWDAAGSGRLPILDLLHLRLSSIREHRRQHLGPVLLGHLRQPDRLSRDEVTQTYCNRVGIEITPDRFQALLVAYWLSRTAHELRTNADRSREWVSENVDLVLEGLVEDTRVLART